MMEFMLCKLLPYNLLYSLCWSGSRWDAWCLYTCGSASSVCTCNGTCPSAGRCEQRYTANHQKAGTRLRCPDGTARDCPPPAWWDAGSHDTDGMRCRNVTSYVPWWWESWQASGWSCSRDADSWGSCDGWAGWACCNLDDTPADPPPPSPTVLTGRILWLWRTGTDTWKHRNINWNHLQVWSQFFNL